MIFDAFTMLWAAWREEVTIETSRMYVAPRARDETSLFRKDVVKAMNFRGKMRVVYRRSFGLGMRRRRRSSLESRRGIVET